MECPLCGTPCMCSATSASVRARPALDAQGSDDVRERPAASAPAYSAMTMENHEQSEAGAWRAEVASRVSSYHARRRRNPAAESASFDFGAPAQASAGRETFDTNYYRRANAEARAPHPPLMSATAPAPEPAAVSPEITIESRELDLELRPEIPAEARECLDRYIIAEPLSQPELPQQDNLIVFPRPLLEPMLPPKPAPDELAEPVLDRPRILEVPEDIMPTVQGSLFPEISLDREAETSSAEPAFEVPLPVARLSDRLMAGAIDIGVTLAGGAIFSAIAWLSMTGFPHTKPFWMMLGAANVLLWALYQYLFLVYRGATPGMIQRGIRLGSFEGRAANWKQRSRRARFLFISLAAVGLGFASAMLDEDSLCWHDRISRTFPTRS